jgi:hypothetical protein
MLDVIVSQPVLPICRGNFIRPSHAEAPVRLIGTFKDSTLRESCANDNRLAWPYIPFPEDPLED